MMHYDVTIIGSGPGGYVAAIRCAQLGMKTALIEKYPTLGGTCLNVGCIPSKAVLDSSERYYEAAHKFTFHGIHLDNLRVDLPQLIAHKAEVVQKTVEGVAYLMKKNRVDVLQGVGSFVDRHTIRVLKPDGKATDMTTTHTIIATGSKPASLPSVLIDKERVITSTEALVLKEVPKHLLVIGGGVIGVELGSVYARMGTKVTVVEYLDALLPSMDRTLGKELQRSLTRLGFSFFFNHQVTAVRSESHWVEVIAEDPSGNPVVFEGDYCLMAIGRKPYTEGLNLEAVGIQKDERGRILVIERLETTVAGIYAIGDVIRGAMLAHKASEEGMLVAEQLAGQKPHLNYRTIPSIVYTWPEVASVGYTEEELNNLGTAYRVGTFPFRANARSRMNQETEGLMKVLADKQTDELLGIHMIGPRASDMIGEATLALEFRAASEDIARLSHGHPTFYETLKEACLAVEGRAIHQ